MSELGFLLFLLTAVTGTATAGQWALREGLDRRPLAVPFLVGYALIYGLVPLANVGAVSSGTYATAGAASFSGLLGLVAGMWAMRSHRDGQELSVVPVTARVEERIPRLVVTSLVVGIIGFLVVVYASTTSVNSFLEAGRLGFRGSARYPVLVLVGGLAMRMLMVPSFLLALSSRRTWRLLGVGWTPLVALAVWLAFDGTRSLAIGIVGAAALGSVVRQAGRETAKTSQRRAWRLLIGGVGGLLVVVMAIALYNARTTLQDEGVSSITRSISEIQLGPDQLVETEPLNYGKWLYPAVELFPGQEDFLWFYPIRRTIFFFVPTGDLKPPDLNNEFARLFPFMNSSTTLPPTLPGEGYISAGGLMGVFPWLFMYGLAIGWLERRYVSSHVFFLLVGSAAVETVILGLRGQLYEEVVRTVSLGLMIYVVWLVARLRVNSGVSRRGTGRHVNEISIWR